MALIDDYSPPPDLTAGRGIVFAGIFVVVEKFGPPVTVIAIKSVVGGHHYILHAELHRIPNSFPAVVRVNQPRIFELVLGLLHPLSD